MPIPESTLSRWSHHQAATALTQAHLPIRAALDAHKSLKQFKYEWLHQKWLSLLTYVLGGQYSEPRYIPRGSYSSFC